MLWEFSAAVYSLDRVSTSVLNLQKTYGVDVNLLLLCCFAAKRQVQLTVADLRCAESKIVDWRAAVTVPLRTVRNRLADDHVFMTLADVSVIRQSVLGGEVASEKVTQNLLEEFFEAIAVFYTGSGEVEFQGLALENLSNYLQVLDILMSREIQGHLEILIQASSTVDIKGGR